MTAKTDELSINEHIYNFIQKNRKVLLIALGCILGVIVVLASVSTIRTSLMSRAFSRVDLLERQYQAIKTAAGEESAEEPETETAAQDLLLLQEELADFQRKNSGFAAARSYAVSANIFSDQENWAEVENAWLNAAKAAPKTYLAPAAYFNAAAAAEEQGNPDRAIELYTLAMDYGSGFIAAPRAQFSIGRIYEGKGDTAAALSAYQAIVSKWPQDQVWVNLAQSRIISLSADL